MGREYINGYIILNHVHDNDDVHVDGVRPRLWTAATNEPIVHPQMTYEYGEPRWNDIDRGKLKNWRKKRVPVPLCSIWVGPGPNPSLRDEK